MATSTGSDPSTYHEEKQMKISNLWSNYTEMIAEIEQATGQTYDWN